MKKYSILVLTALLAGFTSCKNKVEEPSSADFSWYLRADYEANLLDLTKAKANPDTIELSDEICFVAKSLDADSYVIWTGEAGFDYTQRNLSDSLLNDTVNNVSKKSVGLALSSKDGLNRNYKMYNYSAISQAGTPFYIYGTARNYDYESQDYSEVKAGPYEIVVIDSQVDLWNPEDPMNANGATKYDLTFRIPKSVSSTSYNNVTKKTTGEKGFYELVYEDAAKNIMPGVKITYPAGGDPSRAQVIMKVNNCIPNNNGVGTLTYNESYGTYTWIVDLTTPQILTLASQSAKENAGTGDPLTKDYKFEMVEYN